MKSIIGIGCVLCLISCGTSEKFYFLYGSLSGDGRLFSYTQVKESVPSIYIIDIHGNAVKRLGDGTESEYHGAFLEGGFYYVKYFDKTKKSTILKCDTKQFKCHNIYTSSGSIKCLFSYGGRLHFYQSRYVAKTHSDSGYARYIIKSVSFNGDGETIHFAREFSSIRCPVVVDQNVYVSMSFPFDVNPIIDDNKSVISRFDGQLISNGSNYDVIKQNVEIKRSVSVYLKIGNYLNYVALNYNGRFRYGICKNLNTCEIEKSTTNPVYIDGNFYYGIWDQSHRKIQIQKLL